MSPYSAKSCNGSQIYRFSGVKCDVDMFQRFIHLAHWKNTVLVCSVSITYKTLELLSYTPLFYSVKESSVSLLHPAELISLWTVITLLHRSCQFPLSSAAPSFISLVCLNLPPGRQAAYLYALTLSGTVRQTRENTKEGESGKIKGPEL